MAWRMSSIKMGAGIEDGLFFLRAEFVGEGVAESTTTMDVDAMIMANEGERQMDTGIGCCLLLGAYDNV